MAGEESLIIGGGRVTRKFERCFAKLVLSEIEGLNMTERSSEKSARSREKFDFMHTLVAVKLAATGA